MSLAIYRKYRPGQFSDVIGQSHVTVPLMRALDNDRLHHAYLFTGPRGCGKTSSARILARSMNCEKGPTATPCGSCQSCVDLAPNGPGSIDVIEIDAATYRGIDDAKELRERASYAPVTSRYKIYILDEAHQLTKEAFNVLLKLVEEPPPHLRFVFATTEADKILPTLRSRAHQYDFKLVSARVLQEHLAWVCAQEGIAAEGPALGLIARAGAGSVRDSQSLLGQVIAGAGPEGITYADTVAQLGFTDETMLGEVVQAIATRDGAALFRIVDQLMTDGHEPRRFATDLLERFRDLVIAAQVPDALNQGLVDLPDDQIADLLKHAALFTPSELVRIADLVSAGLNELKGAGAPRLQLELLAARLVVPASSDIEARLTALEAGISLGGGGRSKLSDVARAQATAPQERPTTPATPVRATPAPTAAEPRSSTPPPRPDFAATEPASPSTSEASQAVASDPHVASNPEPASESASPAPQAAPAPKTAPKPPTRSSGAVPPRKPSEVAASAKAAVSAPVPEPDVAVLTGDLNIDVLRANWPAIVASLNTASRVSGALFRESSPLSLDGAVLAVAFPNTGVLANAQGGGHLERLAGVLADTFKTTVRVDGMVDPSAAAATARRSAGDVDTGDAAPDDEAVTTKSALDMVTDALGGTVISESPRA